MTVLPVTLQSSTMMFVICFLLSVVALAPPASASIVSTPQGLTILDDLTMPGSVSINYNGQMTSLSSLISLLTQAQPPIGSIQAFAGTTSPSPNWLLCDGSPMRSSDYPSLFSIIGQLHGNGVYANNSVNADSSYNFNLPDYRGLFLRGADPMGVHDPDASGRVAAKVGGATGTSVGSYQADALFNHSHSYVDPGHNHSVVDPGHQHSIVIPSIGTLDPGINGVNPGAAQGTTSSAMTGVSIGKSGVGITINSVGGAETRPKNAAINYLIRVL